MSITLGWWMIPAALTLLLWFGGRRMLGGCESSGGDYSLGGIVEVFLLVPILLAWLVYFAVLYFTGAGP